MFPKAQTVELFDMQNDPGEQTNLATNPAMQPIVKHLFEQLQSLQNDLGDTLELSGDLIGS